MSNTTIDERKIIAWMVGTAATALGLLGGLQTWVFLPQVDMRIERVGAQTRDMISSAIDRHAAQPHPGSITRTEITFILERLKETASKGDIETLSVKIERLTDRVELLEKKTEK